ncbi:hypothetical protein ACFOUR_05720 [Halovivax cerinus]|uniref:Uncharacterized protein n=1 Tax=Halovivax cerinus TaxID=1487865 RepID=A0ABD5NMR5_9EURY
MTLEAHVVTDRADQAVRDRFDRIGWQTDLSNRIQGDGDEGGGTRCHDARERERERERDEPPDSC